MKTTKNVTLAILALAAGSALIMHAQQTPKNADELALHEPVGPTNWAMKNQGSFNITMPETVEVLRIKRPYLRLGETVVLVRLTDEEWEKLVKAYPKDSLQNADSLTDLVFMAPKKP